MTSFHPSGRVSHDPRAEDVMGGESPSVRINYLVPDAPRWAADPAKPVILLEGVVKRFGDRAVLDGLDLEVHTGLTTVVCGQSGSGKSVLLRLIAGLMLPDEGSVRIFGRDTREVGGGELIALRKRMSMMFQSYALLDSLTVEQNIAFPLLENTSLGHKKVFGLVRELLEELDLGQAGEKMPGELSGGMKKRVSLARAVITNPEVVLFDEPTTGLDPVMIEFVDQLIMQTRKRYGITSLIISHDMTSATRLADRMAMLQGGAILAYGSPEEVMATDHEVIHVFFDDASAERGLTDDDLAPERVLPARPESVEDAATPIVELVDVHKTFGEDHVLKGVDLVIAPRTITVLIGGSGSGKSVIMKHVIGLMQPDRGMVKVFGEDISGVGGQDIIAIRQRFGMLFQHAALLDSMSARDNVAFPLIERGVKRPEAREKAQSVMEELQIHELADRFPDAISAGQRKRVGLARAIITRPEILIYDEPTTGQDPVMIRYVDDMIVEAQQLYDITSLVVSHDMSSAFRIAHRIALLHEGRILAFGTPAEVAASPDPQVQRFIYAGTERGDAANAELGLA